MNLTNSELLIWGEHIRKGIGKMTPQESVALLKELVKLRRTVRRMEEKVLKATQTQLLPDG